MNAEFKAKWVAALRSGEYKQGRLRLRHAGRYCCLGVLCDIVDPNGWSGSGWAYKNVWCDLYPPESTDDLIGLTEHERSMLAVINDDHGKTFAEIADHIESNL